MQAIVGRVASQSLELRGGEQDLKELRETLVRVDQEGEHLAAKVEAVEDLLNARVEEHEDYEKLRCPHQDAGFVGPVRTTDDTERK